MRHTCHVGYFGELPYFSMTDTIHYYNEKHVSMSDFNVTENNLVAMER
jgi:hypothetical protein